MFGHSFRQLILVAVVGVATGWLTGLSLSPVAGTVIAALLAAIGALVSALGGVSISSGASLQLTRRVDAAPLAVLAVTIALFAPLGVAARTSGWLDYAHPESIAEEKSDLEQEISMWTDLGASKPAVVNALLAQATSVPTEATPPNTSTEPRRIPLGVGVEEMDRVAQ